MKTNPDRKKGDSILALLIRPFIEIPHSDGVIDS